MDYLQLKATCLRVRSCWLCNACDAEVAFLHFCLQKYLQKACAKFPAQNRCKPCISVITFAAPHVGDAKFVSDFNKRINARILKYKDDFVAQVCLFLVVICRSRFIICFGAMTQLADSQKATTVCFFSFTAASTHS
jgi:hypothetical protein